MSLKETPSTMSIEDVIVSLLYAASGPKRVGKRLEITVKEAEFRSAAKRMWERQAMEGARS